MCVYDGRLSKVLCKLDTLGFHCKPHMPCMLRLLASLRPAWPRSVSFSQDWKRFCFVLVHNKHNSTSKICCAHLAGNIPSGMVARIASSYFLSILAVISDAMKPGATALDVMFLLANSLANVLVRPKTPAYNTMLPCHTKTCTTNTRAAPALSALQDKHGGCSSSRQLCTQTLHKSLLRTSKTCCTLVQVTRLALVTAPLNRDTMVGSGMHDCCQHAYAQ